MERRHGVERWAGASRAFGFGGNLAAALRVLEQVTQSIPQIPALYQSISPRAAAAGGSVCYSNPTLSSQMWHRIFFQIVMERRQNRVRVPEESISLFLLILTLTLFWPADKDNKIFASRMVAERLFFCSIRPRRIFEQWF